VGGLGLVFTLGTGKAETKEDPADSPSSGHTNSMTSLAPYPSKISPVIAAPPAGRVATLAVEDLKEYPKLSGPVQRLLEESLALTREDLSYKYGSDDPADGGMDCSGTVYYLLKKAGVADVPRDASEMYAWVWKKTRFQAVVSTSADTFELGRLQPGDLLFWTGTYEIDRDPPITHVMIYLGTNRQTGRRVMVGASEGRTFNGMPRYGVSVFDFKLPGRATLMGGDVPPGEKTTHDRESRFVGYGSVPGLTEITAPPETAGAGLAPKGPL
jgi:peptidoglycan DL-endopeptidase CwlO